MSRVHDYEYFLQTDLVDDPRFHGPFEYDPLGFSVTIENHSDADVTVNFAHDMYPVTFDITQPQPQPNVKSANNIDTNLVSETVGALQTRKITLRIPTTSTPGKYIAMYLDAVASDLVKVTLSGTEIPAFTTQTLRVPTPTFS